MDTTTKEEAMQLSEEERALINKTLSVVSELNTCLASLRKAGFSCNIQDGPLAIGGSRWYLNVKAMIKKEHYSQGETYD